MDQSLTFGEPDPPKLGEICEFHLGGVWTQPVEFDHVNFKCKLYDALAYNEDFPAKESILPGEWSYVLPFDIPNVAPDTTYNVIITGVNVDQQEVWVIETEF